MSWCRVGSKCCYDMACSREACPGSDLYIYEGSQGLVCCCGTTLDDEGVALDDFYAGGGEDDEAALSRMAKHLLEHDGRGDHVPRSLIVWAKSRNREGNVS